MSVKRIQKIDIDTAKFLYLNLFVHDPIHDYKGNDTRLTNVQHAFNKLEEYVKDAKKGKKTDSQKGGNGDKMDEDDADEDNDDDNAMDDNAMDDNAMDSDDNSGNSDAMDDNAMDSDDNSGNEDKSV